jgi:hypothetical protein
MAKVSQDPPSPIDAYRQAAPADTTGAVPPPPPAAPAYGGTQPYPSYGTYPYTQPAARTNVLAIISLVASCAGLIFGIGAIAGVVTGHIAMSQIRRTGEGGRGLALAGVVVGYCLVGLWLLFVIAYIIFIVVIIGVANSANFNPGNSG